MDGFKGLSCERHECLNDCNGNGVCSVEGKCECKDGFAGINKIINLYFNTNIFNIYFN